MMSVILKEDKWTLEYAIQTFTNIVECKDYSLWKAKQDLPHGDMQKFLDKFGLKKSYVNSRVSLFDAKFKVGLNNDSPANQVLDEAEIIEIAEREDNPLHGISPDMYKELKGKEPEDKIQFLEDVKEEVGKDKPTRKDVRRFKKELHLPRVEDDQPIENIFKRKIKLREALIMVNDEFDNDFHKLQEESLSKGVDVLNLGIKLHEFDDDWKGIYKLLSSVAHPDKGGTDSAQNFLNFMNNVFKDKKKASKNSLILEKMNARLAEIVRG